MTTRKIGIGNPDCKLCHGAGIVVHDFDEEGDFRSDYCPSCMRHKLVLRTESPWRWHFNRLKTWIKKLDW